jgi:hypothetical protein
MVRRVKQRHLTLPEIAERRRRAQIFQMKRRRQQLAMKHKDEPPINTGDDLLLERLRQRR